MNFLKVVMPRNHTNYLFGDMHRGLVASAEDSYFDMINEIHKGTKKQKRAKAAYCMGDMIEGRNSNHPYWDYTNADPKAALPVRQYSMAFKELAPIIKSEQLKLTLSGNHDDTITRTFGNLLEEKCEDSGLFYGDFTCIVTVVDENDKQMYKMYLTHGFKSINNSPSSWMQVEASQKRRLRDLLKEKSHDCHLMGIGHTHKLIIVEPHNHMHLYSNGKKLEAIYHRDKSNTRDIHEDHRWYCNTGSFLRTFVPGVTTYSERAGYDPVEIGYVKVEVKDGVIQECSKVII